VGARSRDKPDAGEQTGGIMREDLTKASPFVQWRISVLGRSWHISGSGRRRV